MNIWQDSNNAPSIPNSSTVSEEENIKLSRNRYNFKSVEVKERYRLENERNNKGGKESCG